SWTRLPKRLKEDEAKRHLLTTVSESGRTAPTGRKSSCGASQVLLRGGGGGYRSVSPAPHKEARDGREPRYPRQELQHSEPCLQRERRRRAGRLYRGWPDDAKAAPVRLPHTQRRQRRPSRRRAGEQPEHFRLVGVARPLPPKGFQS